MEVVALGSYEFSFSSCSQSWWSCHWDYTKDSIDRHGMHQRNIWSSETYGVVKAVSGMHQRKAEMARHAAAFIAFTCVTLSVRKQVNGQAFDHFVLAMQWPPSFSVSSHTFTIHGLWPGDSLLTVGYPIYCTNEVFDRKVGMSLPALPTVWPNYKGNNEAFWSYQWRKHGTCSGLSQRAYFKLAIALARKFDLAAVLGRGNIIGNGHNAYPTNDFINAFLAVYPNNVPKLVCAVENSVVWLSEFRFNYTNDDDTGAAAALQSMVGMPYTNLCGGIIKY